MKKINFGIIGTGQIIRDAYLPILPFIEEIDKLFFFDINQENATKLIKEYDRWICDDIFEKDYGLKFDDAKEKSLLLRKNMFIVSNKEEFAKVCDVILITTPPNTHLSTADYFISRGKKVLVEKPVDITLSAIDEFISKHGVELNLKFRYMENFVYNPCFKKFSLKIEEGILGDVLFIKTFLANSTINSTKDFTHWRFSKDISGGGVLYDWAPHTFATSMLFAGTTKIDDVKVYEHKKISDLNIQLADINSDLDVYNISQLSLEKNKRKIEVLVENSWLASKNNDDASGSSWISIEGTKGNLIIKQIKVNGKKSYLIITKLHRSLPFEEIVDVEFPHDAYYYALKHNLNFNSDSLNFHSISFARTILKLINATKTGETWEKE